MIISKQVKNQQQLTALACDVCIYVAFQGTQNPAVSFVIVYTGENPSSNIFTSLFFLDNGIAQLTMPSTFLHDFRQFRAAVEEMCSQITGEIPRYLMYMQPAEEGTVRIYLQDADDLAEYRAVLAALPHPRTNLMMGAIVAVYRLASSSLK